jgi:hypothetical protein
MTTSIATTITLCQIATSTAIFRLSGTAHSSTAGNTTGGTSSSTVR